MHKSNFPTELAQRLERLQVLVVVSGVRAGEIIERIFHQLGFSHLLTAYNPEQALAMMREVRVDLIVTDAKLPASSPLLEQSPDRPEEDAPLPVGDEPPQEMVSCADFVRELRHSGAAPNPYIPVIMLTDRATSDEILAARDAGVNEVLLKPIDARNFCFRLVQVIDRPRPFVTAKTYKGPCRRRTAQGPIDGQERRKREVRLFRSSELRQQVPS